MILSSHVNCLSNSLAYYTSLVHLMLTFRKVNKDSIENVNQIFILVFIRFNFETLLFIKIIM
jgi:hypothetical protein